jgi:hypothetical protein
VKDDLIPHLCERVHFIGYAEASRQSENSRGRNPSKVLEKIGSRDRGGYQAQHEKSRAIVDESKQFSSVNNLDLHDMPNVSAILTHAGSKFLISPLCRQYPPRSLLLPETPDLLR